MIRIISGAVGVPAKYGLDLKTRESGPFRTDPALEKDLVRRGVAEYVSADPEPEVLPDDAENITGIPEYSADMPKKELLAICDDAGVEYAKADSREKLCNRLDAFFAENLVDDDDDDAPAFDAADAIE